MIALFSPLVGFILGMLLKKRWPFFAKKIILFFISLSFVSSVFILFSSLPSHVILWQWILNVYWGIFIDQTIAILLCMVSFISLIIHIYSLDYMSNDPQKISFLAQLSFFTFSMMLFLVSPHLLQLFVGWEAISLASYMLIEFWHHNKKACDASLKAFLVNRFADVFVILGIALFYVQSGTFSILTPVQVSNPSLISLLLFIGVMAKSAQIGFHIWLPDAMEGPTPVSALIHAATMVTAGIILMIRMPFLFAKASDIQHMIVFIGCITALYGAFFACTQTDIKKIIAYSTCSQLGFMTMSCGIGAYKIALFHLIMHAFFKALLFLGVGSVIHALSNEQNIYNMGGLYNKIPYTYASMWVGFLNLLGIPFFSGYYSKEAILNQFNHSYYFHLMLLTVVLTSFYSARLMYVVFHAKYCASERITAYLHESPFFMRFSLLILAFLSIVLGKFHTFFTQEMALTWRSNIPWILSLLVVFIVFYKKSLIAKNQFSLIKDPLNDKIMTMVIPRFVFFSIMSSKIEYGIDKILSEFPSYLSLFLSKKYKKLQTGFQIQYMIWTGCSIVFILILEFLRVYYFSK